MHMHMHTHTHVRSCQLMVARAYQHIQARMNVCVCVYVWSHTCRWIHTPEKEPMETPAPISNLSLPPPSPPSSNHSLLRQREGQAGIDLTLFNILFTVVLILVCLLDASSLAFCTKQCVRFPPHFYVLPKHTDFCLRSSSLLFDKKKAAHFSQFFFLPFFGTYHHHQQFTNNPRPGTRP